jgi:membrane protein
MRPSNPWKLGGLTVVELARRLWRETQKDELLGRAAQLSYYALLALFPALIFLTALMGLFSVESFMPELMSYLRNVLPADALSMVQRFLTQVAEGSGANILSLGALGALWASSSGVTAIMDALNVVFGVQEDRRPFWRVRLTAIVLTIGVAFTWMWNVLQWPIIAGLMLIVVAAIYHICPDRQYKHWRWITPGSLFAVVMWLIVSLGFKAYVDNFGDYNKVYGSIAGVIVLMLWFYWSGMVLLLGGEINAEIENAVAARHAGSAELKRDREAA